MMNCGEEYRWQPFETHPRNTTSPFLAAWGAPYLGRVDVVYWNGADVVPVMTTRCVRDVRWLLWAPMPGEVRLCRRGASELEEAKDRAAEAVDIIYRFGGTDGDHHKQWVIDQTLRALLGDDYDAWVEEYEDGGEYEWDTGIAP